MNKQDFLEPEYREEFYVDEKRKALWKTELDMFEAFDALCQKHNLKYFLMAGGMLGAVRHKGFIPWDDDIDIAMLREDYDIFMNVAPNELPTPLFLQDGMNEKMYFDSIVRIRDPRTTGIIRKDLTSSCNNGVFIEIFPYDNIPDNAMKAKIQDIMIRFYKNILLRNVYLLEFESAMKRIVFQLISDVAIMLWGRDGIYRKYDHWCRKYNNNECEYRNILTAYSYRSTFKYKKSVITDLIRVPYEYTYAYIPRNYDVCLTQVYHDYMLLPPVEKRGKKHEDIVIYDATVDYKTYLEGIKSGKYENPFLKNKRITVRREKKW